MNWSYFFRIYWWYLWGLTWYNRGARYVPLHLLSGNWYSKKIERYEFRDKNQYTCHLKVSLDPPALILRNFIFHEMKRAGLFTRLYWGRGEIPPLRDIYGSVSAGRGKRLFRVLFFWKVEPSCCKTWHSRVYFSIVSSKLGLVDQKITSWPSVMIFYMIFI